MHRRMIRDSLSAKMCLNYREVQEVQARRLVARVAETPEAFDKALTW